jgi:Fe-S cluster assembly ATPase SufC
MVDGRVVRTGGPELAASVEAHGFDTFREQVA